MSARPYRSARRLARGGMGQVEMVVRAEGSFRRIHALKRLHAHYAEDPEVRAMFVDEARIAGLIRHANVVGVLDAGEDADGPFLVMEYVEGVSIAELLGAIDGPLPVSVALEIVRQAAEGLHAAHELRSPDGLPLDVVHRDVSPQNVLVGFDGLVRVTDFGIARALDRLTQTADGCLKGKAGYMSPEQLRFAPVDRRSDLFSLGVVLYELVIGERLYAGDRPTAFRRILEEAPPKPSARRPELPAAVDDLVLRMLAKQPADRPSSAREVAEAASAALRELPPTPLAAFLEDRLPEQRAAQRTMVAEALSDVGPPPEDGAATEIDRARPPTAAARPERGSRALRVAAVGVLFVGAAALGLALWARDADDEVTAPSVSAPPAQVEEPEPAAPPADDVPAPEPPAPVARTEPQAEPSPEADDPAEAEEPATEEDPRPARRRRDRRRAGDARRLGWGWNER